MQKRQRKYVITEAPSNLGLIEPSPGQEPGVKFLSQVLLDLNIGATLPITASQAVIPPAYSMVVDPESNVRNADSIAPYSRMLSDRLLKFLSGDFFQLVLGGDCSILIGCALALKKKGRYGLFFIDGHTDYVTPSQSGTAGAAGMDLAIVTGNGPAKLADMDGLRPYFNASHVFCFGNRTYVDWYEMAIEESGISYFNLVSIRRLGIELVVNRFLEMVEKEKLDGFWLHFDVDALSDHLMPCVDSRTEGGLTYEELAKTLLPLISSPLARGMNITILDPTRDPDHLYSATFVNEMNSIFRDGSVDAK